MHRRETRAIKTAACFSPKLHIPHSLGFEYDIVRKLDQFPETLLHLVLTARTAKQTQLSTRGGAACYHVHTMGTARTRHQTQFCAVSADRPRQTILRWLSLPLRLRFTESNRCHFHPQHRGSVNEQGSRRRRRRSRVSPPRVTARLVEALRQRVRKL